MGELHPRSARPDVGSQWTDDGSGRDRRGLKRRPLATITYRRAWDQARRSALADEEYRSLLARRPYDLHDACPSTWLNGGVAPAQVAEWAGHSVEILLRLYAKCLEGQDEIARRRIVAALGQADQ